MWIDIDTEDDLLNFRVIAQTISEFISESKDDPLSIGISGDWGVGKSSLVRMISNELQALPASKNKYIFVAFNAWLYQGFEDAKIALLQKIHDELYEKYKTNSGILEKLNKFLSKIRWLKCIKIGSGIAAASAPILEPIFPGASAAAPVVAGIAGALPESDNTSVDLNDSVLRGIEELRKDFGDIIKSLGIKLVLIVDDLDRCLPDTAISTLEAIRLLLFLPNTVYIIAADQQMIKDAVKAKFPFQDQSEKYAISYFDKLIQIPIQVPYLGINEVKVYIFLLLMEELFRTKKLPEDAYRTGKKQVLELLEHTWE